MSMKAKWIAGGIAFTLAFPHITIMAASQQKQIGQDQAPLSNGGSSEDDDIRYGTDLKSLEDKFKKLQQTDSGQKPEWKDDLEKLTGDTETTQQIDASREEPTEINGKRTGAMNVERIQRVTWKKERREQLKQLDTAIEKRDSGAITHILDEMLGDFYNQEKRS
ncbi:hypothetical protein [Priestia koreensis]|uniref:hypothetical protein n=1 Tax=Priestia koreensis TaxID=284581 RepID=UPI001F5A6901|nr:hypothetical protein [Priestia koreensis]MCM3003469.1 hypothetical protein [Priestia koreensis]UNL86259.1 hypothetical protein IE339_07110 [Priestia koreensis]